MNDIMLAPVIPPLVAGFLLLFLPRRMKAAPRIVTLLVSLMVCAAVAAIFWLKPRDYSWNLLEIGGFQLDFTLKYTAMGGFILLFAALFGLLITLYSLTLKGIEKVNEYYGSILLTIGGACGILLSDNLIFLLIFWEIVTASLYLLISTGGKDSPFAATKTFAMIGLSDGAFLLGVLMVGAISGSFLISECSITPGCPLTIIAFLLLMTAAITKAGAMPMHSWIPTSGESAPASVMALLPAAIDKLLGIYLLVICVNSLFKLTTIANSGLSLVLCIIGAATIIIAVMIAMVQHNLKKLLSYHAVSQVGYMILGIATLTPVGIAGGVFHMLNNAIYKCCLFLGGGAVEKAAGTPDLDELGGLGGKMPITFGCCLIAALSISGVPPFNGFVSKWMIYQGVIKMPATGGATVVAGLWPVWLIAAMFGSALTLASFVKLLHSLFLSRTPDSLRDVREVSPLMTGPMVVLAVLCVLFGVFYLLPLDHLIYPALDSLKNMPALGELTGTWDSTLATSFLLFGICIGLVIVLIGVFSRKVRTVPTWNCGEVKVPNDRMIIPGTHFYKTVTAMEGLKGLYEGQEKGHFDPYNHGSGLGSMLSGLLRWLHGGILPTYLTWVILGLLVVIIAISRIW